MMAGGVMSGCRGGIDSCGIGSGDNCTCDGGSGSGGGAHLRRYSDADVQRAVRGRRRLDGDNILRQLPCSKHGKPYKTETKDIDTQASDAILALGVGYRLTV